MIRKQHILTLLAAAAFLCVCCGKAPQTTPETPPEVEPESFFCKGADISWVTEMEGKGYKFYNAAGQERELTALMKEIGCNAIRLRVWVNPTGGWNGQADVVAKAKRAQALGLKLLIDFHYSDSWADPGKQTVPAAWQGKDATAMAAAVKAHTQEVLQALKAAGVDVAWVQVGNETTNGMLWDSGKVAGSSAGQFVNYFHAGREAVKALYPQAKVILHLDNAWWTTTSWACRSILLIGRAAPIPTGRRRCSSSSATCRPCTRITESLSCWWSSACRPASPPRRRPRCNT